MTGFEELAELVPLDDVLEDVFAEEDELFSVLEEFSEVDDEGEIGFKVRMLDDTAEAELEDRTLDEVTEAGLEDFSLEEDTEAGPEDRVLEKEAAEEETVVEVLLEDRSLGENALAEDELSALLETLSEELVFSIISGFGGIFTTPIITNIRAQNTAPPAVIAAMFGAFLASLSAAFTVLTESYLCSGLKRIHFSITRLYSDLL